MLLYDEQVMVDEAPFVTEEVRIGKQAVTEQQQHSVELQYEVLVVEVLVVDEQPADAAPPNTTRGKQL